MKKSAPTTLTSNMADYRRMLAHPDNFLQLALDRPGELLCMQFPGYAEAVKFYRVLAYHNAKPRWRQHNIYCYREIESVYACA